MSELEIIKIVAPLIIGVILGYLANRFEIGRDRLGIKRTRTLENIKKVEEFLALLAEADIYMAKVRKVNRENRETKVLMDNESELFQIKERRQKELSSQAELTKHQSDELASLIKIAPRRKNSKDKNTKELTRDDLNKTRLALNKEWARIIDDMEQNIKELEESTTKFEEFQQKFRSGVEILRDLQSSVADIQKKLDLTDIFTVSLVLDSSQKLTMELATLYRLYKDEEEDYTAEKIQKRVMVETYLNHLVR